MQSYAQFMTVPRTITEIIAFKREQAAKGTVAKVEDMGVVQQKYNYVASNFVLPVSDKDGMPATPSEQAVKTLVSKVKGLKFVESIRMNVNGKETLAKNMTQLYTTGSVDNLMGTVLNACMARKGQEGTEKEYEEAIKDVGDYYWGGGTLLGLMRRLETGLGKGSDPDRPDPAVSPEEEKYIMEVLPFNRDAFVSMVGKSPADISPPINMQAQAGAPWFDPTIRVFDKAEDILESAQKLYHLAGEGYKDLKKYLFEDRREEGVVLLKNKRELSKRKNALEKVRPYYVFPGALRFLFQCFSKNYSGATMNYLENPKSISAFRFSWMYGGAEKLLQWVIDGKPKTGGRFVAIAFGDDQFWVIYCENGEVLVTAPDIIAMDMSIGKKTTLGFGKKMIGDVDGMVDEVWKRIIVLLTQYFTTHLLIVSHSLVVAKGEGGGLSSGIDLTTHVDIFMSARIIYRATKILSNCKNSNDAIIKMKEVGSVLEKQLGLRIKPGTETVEVFDGKNLGVTFLGCTVRECIIEGYKVTLPVPDISKFTASMFYSKYSNKDKAKMDGLMAKAVGICASGGFSNNLLFHACRRLYDYHAKVGGRPTADIEWFEGDVPGPVKAFLDHTGLEAAKPFPPRLWFLSLYVPEKFGTELLERIRGWETKAESGSLGASQNSSSSSSTSSSSSSSSSFGVVDDDESLLLGMSQIPLPPPPKKGAKWSEIDEYESMLSSSVAEGPEVKVEEASEMKVKEVSMEKAGRFPPDLQKRLVKMKRMERKSQENLRAKQLKWEKQKQQLAKAKSRSKSKGTTKEDRVLRAMEEELESQQERVLDFQEEVEDYSEVVRQEEERFMKQYEFSLKELEDWEAAEAAQEEDDFWDDFYDKWDDRTGAGGY